MELFGQPISWLELIGTVFGIIGVWLTVKQNILCFPAGIINVLLYAIVFFLPEQRLYADGSLQIFYFFLLVYGWYNWGKEKEKAFTATKSSLSLAVVLFIVALLGTLIIGFVFKNYTDASLPYLDSALTSASLVAQWMIARKKIENWIVWIVADVIYVGMYIYKHLYLTSLLYLIFIPIAVMGWREWKKNLRHE